MTEQNLLTTESERYFINVSDEIIAWSEVSWIDIFRALDESEKTWREWLIEGLLTPFSAHTDDPLCSFKKSADDNNDDLTFLISSRYEAATKYRFILRQSLYFDWMDMNGLVPLTYNGKRRMRFAKEYDVDEALRSLSASETESMWRSILIDEDTRISTVSGHLEGSLRYDVDRVRKLAQQCMDKEGPLDFLNRMFRGNITSEGEKLHDGTIADKRVQRLSVVRFIVFMANEGHIALPAKALAENVKGLSFVYTGFIKGHAIRRLAGHRRGEIEAGMAHLSVDHKGARQLRLADIFILFCASNYGSSDEFAPQLLALAQAAAPGHFNNIRPYLNGIKEFHQISYEEYRKWDAVLRGRNSKALSEGPFSLFSLQL